MSRLTVEENLFVIDLLKKIRCEGNIKHINVTISSEFNKKYGVTHSKCRDPNQIRGVIKNFKLKYYARKSFLSKPGVLVDDAPYSPFFEELDSFLDKEPPANNKKTAAKRASKLHNKTMKPAKSTAKSTADCKEGLILLPELDCDKFNSPTDFNSLFSAGYAPSFQSLIPRMQLDNDDPPDPVDDLYCNLGTPKCDLDPLTNTNHQLVSPLQCSHSPRNDVDGVDCKSCLSRCLRRLLPPPSSADTPPTTSTDTPTTASTVAPTASTTPPTASTAAPTITSTPPTATTMHPTASTMSPTSAGHDPSWTSTSDLVATLGPRTPLADEEKVEEEVADEEKVEKEVADEERLSCQSCPIPAKCQQSGDRLQPDQPAHPAQPQHPQTSCRSGFSDPLQSTCYGSRGTTAIKRLRRAACEVADRGVRGRGRGGRGVRVGGGGIGGGVGGVVGEGNGGGVGGGGRGGGGGRIGGGVGEGNGRGAVVGDGRIIADHHQMDLQHHQQNTKVDQRRRLNKCTSRSTPYARNLATPYPPYSPYTTPPTTPTDTRHTDARLDDEVTGNTTTTTTTSGRASVENGFLAYDPLCGDHQRNDHRLHDTEIQRLYSRTADFGVGNSELSDVKWVENDDDDDDDYGEGERYANRCNGSSAKRANQNASPQQHPRHQRRSPHAHDHVIGHVSDNTPSPADTLNRALVPLQHTMTEILAELRSITSCLSRIEKSSGHSSPPMHSP